ncbi:hypothetical protein E5288_WYG007695 [Bos mutus]|uniref:Uncharacterized protein n=1 Tax=Bos mutus TaxID=72004 RepID=A0A6B0RAC5_9CETA|nr:hypothetical protein [Bos mutus]
MPSRTARYARYSPRQRRRRLLADRSVRFPNDVLFLDHIRQGDLEQVGRFIRTRKVSLDTIYPSGLPFAPRYLISLGADREAANDDGDLPSDLIDPEFKDLVELFKGTKMD